MANFYDATEINGAEYVVEIEFHPAAMIEEWARESNISLAWLGVGI